MVYTYGQYDLETSPDINAAVLGGIFLFFIFFALVSYAVVAFLLSRIFKKAGVPEWAAWVPIYNNWKLLELGNQPGFWAILNLVPFVNIVAMFYTYISMYDIGLKLQKAGWFVVVAIFLPLIWLIWLAFDDSKWPPAKKQIFKNADVKKRRTHTAKKST